MNSWMTKEKRTSSKKTMTRWEIPKEMDLEETMEVNKEQWVDCNQNLMMMKELRNQVAMKTKILNKKKMKKKVVLITIFDLIK